MSSGGLGGSEYIVPDARVKTAMNNINAARAGSGAGKGRSGKNNRGKKSGGRGGKQTPAGREHRGTAKSHHRRAERIRRGFSKSGGGVNGARRDDTRAAHAISGYAEGNWRVVEHQHLDVVARTRRNLQSLRTNQPGHHGRRLTERKCRAQGIIGCLLPTNFRLAHF
jgi:hypothetical protein